MSLCSSTDRGLFLTQFTAGDTLEDGGILEVDLRNISLLEREKQSKMTVAVMPDQETEELDEDNGEIF